MSDVALEAAMAEIEIKVRWCADEIVASGAAELGRPLPPGLLTATVDFVISQLSAEASEVFRREIAAGRGDAVLQRMVATINDGGLA